MQTNIRNKTLKKHVDISGTPGPWKGPTSEALESFLNAGVNEAFKRPWHRLERGLRLNRLNLFAQEEKARLSLTDDETHDLYNLLIKSLDKKILNSKSTVNYDHEKERILEIKGLVSHRNADGYNLFQIIERKSQSVTFRKPRTVAATAAAASPVNASQPTTTDSQ
jgi:hypothetical protein